MKLLGCEQNEELSRIGLKFEWRLVRFGEDVDGVEREVFLQIYFDVIEVVGIRETGRTGALIRCFLLVTE